VTLLDLISQELIIRLSLLTLLISVAFLIFLMYSLFRAYVKIRVLRHELISLSDWSSQTIEEIKESATDAIVSEVLTFRPHLSRDKAEMFVPQYISTSQKLWEQAIDRTQARLVRNGMKPLNSEDKQFLLSSLIK
jgi:hypothetical protein